MNIKKATIVGVLQDWDVNDYRFDIERVNFDVPISALCFYTDDEINDMIVNGFYGGDDESVLGELVRIGLDDGWFNRSKLCRYYWQPEDPCELKLEIKEGA